MKSHGTSGFGLGLVAVSICGQVRLGLVPFASNADGARGHQSIHVGVVASHQRPSFSSPTPCSSYGMQSAILDVFDCFDGNFVVRPKGKDRALQHSRTVKDRTQSKIFKLKL